MRIGSGLVRSVSASIAAFPAAEIAVAVLPEFRMLPAPVPRGIKRPPLSSLTSNIVSAEQHRAIRIEQTRIHFLGRSQFYQQPVCIKYSIHCWLGKVARLSSVLQRSLIPLRPGAQDVVAGSEGSC